MKQRAERDRKLSHPAARLLAILISEQYCDRHFMADDEFPLPWSTARRWISLEEKQCYHYLSELTQRGYLFNAGLRGCPATKFYRFGFTPKDEESSSVKKEGTGYVKKEGTSSAKNHRPLISNPFGKNNGIKGGGVATAPGKTIERAKPVSDEVLAERGRELGRQMRAALEGNRN